MLATIGYERAELKYFIGTLQKAKIELLVDVRDRAQSRRKGFSKTALAEALASAGIEYVHFRSLGDPKEGREAARAGQMQKFKKIYAGVLKTKEAKDALAEVTELAVSQSICLMCYERDHRECHRKIVADHLERVLDVNAQHLGVQQIEPKYEQTRRVLHNYQSAAA